MADELKSGRVWLVRCGYYGQDESECIELGLVVVGFKDVPSLCAAKNRQEVLEIVNRSQPEAKPSRNRNRAAQLNAFARRIAIGDIVAAPLKSRPGFVALGKVKSDYQFAVFEGAERHLRKVEWVRTDVPRTEFKQDMIFSLGAAMTVCQITRNDAEQRFAAVISGRSDPGPGTSESGLSDPQEDLDEPTIDIEEIARNQIRDYIRANFSGHEFSRLVEGLLQAEGYTTLLSAPGPDGGVDILAGRGPLGFDQPKLCVQVKSTGAPADVTVLRTLQGSMQSFRAEHGLLVSWGGFNRALMKEARLSYFKVRLWHADDVIESLFENYAKLPDQLRNEIPLSRIWMLTADQA